MKIRKTKMVVPDEETLKMITGIENLEMFLEDDDQWMYNDSEIRNIHWDDKKRTLDVTVEPIGYSVEIDDAGCGKSFLLDFHFGNVESVCFDYSSYGYISEMEIKVENGFLVCTFDSYLLKVVAESLAVDPPRIVERN